MRGRAIALSLPRKLIGDLMHFSAGVPTVPVQRRMDLSAVVAARQACRPRPPWTAIFAKAFAIVAEEFPPLRRAYCKLPRPHLYEFPVSVASIAVEREYREEPVVLGIRVKDPAGTSLAEVAEQIRRAATAPLDSIKQFRRIMRISSLPRPIRRLLWWLGLNVGRWRGRHFGTFGISVYSSLGAESLHPISPFTCTLNYGRIGDDGQVMVRLIYDHRVLDGATVARALARLEEVLRTDVRAEMIDTVKCGINT